MNNKGYLLVEIIVASVLAMTITYFLVDITINLKNINDDYYVETKLETDQILMLEDVMNDLSSYELLSVHIDDNVVDFTFNINNSQTVKRITLTDTTYTYGTYSNGVYSNDGLFVNTFDEVLDVGNIKIENLCYQDGNYVDCSTVSGNVLKGLLTIDIPAYTIYSDINYGLNLSIPYSYKNLDIVVEEDKFLYYSSVVEENGNTLVKINRCLEDYTECSEVATAYTMVNDNFSSVNPSLTANSTNWYYASSRYGTDSYTNSMNLFMCTDNTCSDSPFANSTSYLNGNLSIPASIISNDNYIYYTSVRLSNNTTNTSVMDIYICNVDGSDCRVFSSLDAFTKLGDENIIGNSLLPSLSVNDEYLYYTSVVGDVIDNKVNMDIYRCNIDGTNCNKFSSLVGLVEDDGSNMHPTILADNNNVYYTTSSDTTSVMDIYRCDKDGGNCNKITSASSYLGGADSPISFSPKLAVNDSYLYFTSSKLEGSGYTNNLVLNRCNKDGSDCKTIEGLHGYIASGLGISPTISVNNHNVYYLTSKYDNNNSSYMTNFSLVKCNIELEECSEVGSVSGFANSSGSTIYPHLLLTK